VLKANPGRYKHIIVILVDAFIEPIGKSSKNPEPRSTFSHYIDMNFMDSFDALLKINRQIGINEFLKENTALRDKMTFWHITFDKVDENVIDIKPLSNDDNKPDIITLRDESNFIKPLSDDDNKPKIRTLREGLNSIETTLSISDDDKARIEEAVRIIFNKDRPCLERIKKILLNKNPDGLNLTLGQAACR
jgi:hypothetical protein